MRPNKLLYVDAMRGWAILMVIACHQALPFHDIHPLLKLMASYGQTGVFLFFVASAFTLCNSTIERANEETPTRNFYLRRFFRIAPLYYIGMAFYFLLQTAFPQYAEQQYTPLNVLANLALVHGLMPGAFTGTVPGGWSVGTECVFYALFPGLFLACQRLHAAFGWKVLLAPMLTVAIASFLLLSAIGMSADIYWFWYDSILTQLPVFLIGTILFFLVRDGLFRPRLGRDVPAFLLATIVAVLVRKFTVFSLLPLSSAISFAFLFNILRAVCVNYGLIEKIGRVSYSMYIFHFAFVGVVTKLVLSTLPPLGAWENLLYAFQVILSIAAAFAVSSVSEKFVERRFIEFGRHFTR